MRGTMLRIGLALTAVIALGLATVGFVHGNQSKQAPAMRLVDDSSSYDYWTQIVEHRVPQVQNGATRYFPGGRYYVGPNGLEVRFTSRATQVIFGAAAAGGGYLLGPEFITWASQSLTPMVRNALSNMNGLTKSLIAGGAGTAASSYIPGDQCLGITLPLHWVVDYLDDAWGNLQAIAGGEIPLGYGYNVPVWLESCS